MVFNKNTAAIALIMTIGLTAPNVAAFADDPLFQDQDQDSAPLIIDNFDMKPKKTPSENYFLTESQSDPTGYCTSCTLSVEQINTVIAEIKERHRKGQAQLNWVSKKSAPVWVIERAEALEGQMAYIRGTEVQIADTRERVKILAKLDELAKIDKESLDCDTLKAVNHTEKALKEALKALK